MRKYELKIDDRSFSIEVKHFSSRSAELKVNGKVFKVRVDQIADTGRPVPVRTAASARSPAVTGQQPSAPAPAPGGGPGSVTAPIPGQIIEVFVEEGDEVEAGQPVLRMEAMKMENVVNSPTAGTVGSIRVNPGDSVTQGQELMVVG